MLGTHGLDTLAASASGWEELAELELPSGADSTMLA